MQSLNYQSFDSFDHEDKVGVCGNWSDGSASVGSFRGAENFDFGSNFHVEADFVPALDDLTDTDVEIEGLSSVVAGVELGSISEGTFVVHVDFLALSGGGAVSTLGKDFDGVLFDEVFGECGKSGDDGQSAKNDSFHFI